MASPHIRHQCAMIEFDKTIKTGEDHHIRMQIAQLRLELARLVAN